MNKVRIFSLLAVVSIGAAFTSTKARADAWDKMTKVTISQAIEVPGAVLQPGTYTFKLVTLAADRHIVTVMNDRENHVFTTIMALNTERLDPTGRTVFSFYETPAGRPPAVKDWYYPGDNFGQEFIYKNRNFQQVSEVKHEEAQQVAQAAPPPPPPAEAAPVPEPAPEAAAPPAAVIAQNEPPAAEPPAPAETPAPATAPVLPQTASDVPLLTLLGFLSLGAAAGLGGFAKSFNK